MAAEWRLLTEYLRSAPDSVVLQWAELDRIVGGLPNSAIDHYPQWWHGDRANTRAWRAAGYAATDIRPGVSVRFVRTGRGSPAMEEATPSLQTSSRAQTAGSVDDLSRLHQANCLIVIPCSAAKRPGGRRQPPTTTRPDLAEARRAVLNMPGAQGDQTLVMPAWQRYVGRFYQAAGPVLGDLASEGRLLILSGGYGVLDGQDLIGNYNRRMRTLDWPRGLLESVLADCAAERELNVLAFAGSTTNYAKVLRRTPWRLAPGVAANLVSMKDVRGQVEVSRSLGEALRAFVTETGAYPPGTSIERLV